MYLHGTATKVDGQSAVAVAYRVMGLRAPRVTHAVSRTLGCGMDMLFMTGFQLGENLSK